jgi:alcohol dehydrogenase class IV
VTPYAVINNSVTGRKFTLGHPSLRPVQAAIDPTLLRALPGPARLATALDAFIHCLEARLTRADAWLIWPLAEAGLELGWRLLPLAAATDPDDSLLAELARLSLYGGISIAHSRTGLIHTLSVAFASFCDLPHGLLNARLLPHALAHNLPGYDGLLAQVVGRCGGTPMADDAAALQRLTDWLGGLIGCQLPPASGAAIRARQAALVARLLQDGGLPGVSHGTINEAALTALVARIADAAG